MGPARAPATRYLRRRAAAAVRENPHCRLLSILSRDMDRAREFAAQHGAERAYDRLDDFLADPDLEAVYVASEVYRHCPETLAAASAGRHVLCEKPMALTVEGCARMVERCARAPVNR